jgi:hypothetical protein
VSMAYNKLVGSLPQELGQLTALETLSLSHNNMYGNIPGSIGLLENLGKSCFAYKLPCFTLFDESPHSDPFTILCNTNRRVTTGPQPISW